ncbi:MAG: glycoside hydrolase domain-containing protein [Myxococcota bacterium]
MDPVPAEASASIAAARNEFEPFQIVVGGAATGVKAQVSDLVGPDGAVVPAGEITLYRAGLYEVATPSNTEGDVGRWPDPLVPDVDAYYGEKRDAFPFDVPAGEVRSIWVEVFVPKGTPAGTYAGQVSVTGEGVGSVEVPVSLRVRNFELPSTSSLRTAFGMGWDAGCVAHHGSYEACGYDQGVEHYHTLYGRAALDHRISIETLVYYYGNYAHFDAVYGPLLGGTADTRLEGARQTTLRVHGGNLTAWQGHFDDEGWDARLFDYTCDEPPNGCAWSDIGADAPAVQEQGIPTLVTTGLSSVKEHDLVGDIDILVPIVQHMDDKGGYDRRAEYDEFLAMGPDKELWWYQSCISHGCGYGCTETTSDYHTGWPSYMIDSAGIQNRAMEWLSFTYDISGELYFETTWMLDSAWDSSCDFSGNGDGTLFYPGTPARIGGETDIPVASIRLKLIREGMEDYEYLKLLADLGDEPLAREVAEGLFAKPYEVAAASPQDLYDARRQIAERIEELVDGGSATAPACEPTTCAEAGADCGTVSDGCGGTLDCGGCVSTQSNCEPLTCEDVGAECGSVADACGGMLDCGGCDAGETCGLEEPHVCGATCDRRTCEEAGAECGAVSDGCGGILDCGGCGAGESCGLDAPNRCAIAPASCEPETCTSAGVECGTTPDGCGGTLYCGPCEVGEPSEQQGSSREDPQEEIAPSAGEAATAGPSAAGGCAGAGTDAGSGWGWMALLVAGLLMVTRRRPRPQRARVRRDDGR